MAANVSYFRPSLLIASKAEWGTFYGRASALLSIIRLACYTLQGTNTLAYFTAPSVTKKNSFQKLRLIGVKAMNVYGNSKISQLFLREHYMRGLAPKRSPKKKE